MQTGFNFNDLYQEAQTRWLKPVEVMYILQNHEQYQITQETPQQPPSGSLFLFNRRVLRFFRKDGHNWRKKRDGRTVGEAHERLKVGNVEALNCYYAHGEQNPTFQRRSYWMLDPAYEHIVLVHYRETSEGRSNSGPATEQSPGSSSTFSQSSSSYTTQKLGSASMLDDSYEPNQSLPSPGSVEFAPDIVIKNNEVDNLDGADAVSGNSTGLEVTQALRRLEEQLSLNEDSFKEIDSFSSEQDNTNDSSPQQNTMAINNQDVTAAWTALGNHGQSYDGHNARQDHSCSDGIEKTLYWKEMLDLCKPLCSAWLQEEHVYRPAENENLLSSSGILPIANHESSQLISFGSNNAENSAFSLTQDIHGVRFSPYSSLETQEANLDCYPSIFDQNQIEAPLDINSSLTVGQKQKFTIKEVSPEWGYATEATKVIIVGSFLCHPTDSTWFCMFGDVQVPVEIIQDGVIRCEAPSHLPPGKVTLCITSGNWESCSEVREFEYRNKDGCPHCNSLETESTRSPEELLLLVRFAQVILSDSSMMEYGVYEMGKQKYDDDTWSHVIEALLVGSGTSSGIVNWLLEELLKDKLQLWLSSRSHKTNEETGPPLSKKEQGIIHMIAALGFEWALNPILSCGVNINFRDINGWTALHWAARFGREKMVASLIASGASAGAVTDPTSQDPAGKTAASIAANSGHKGLAGYLSEVSLTSHLSSLTLEETELSKGSAELQAEITVNNVSNEHLNADEDQISLKHTLAAVRNAAQAAARIQSAFRAHSFRKRREREAAISAAGIDRYVISDNIPELSAVSKLTSYNSRDFNSAAISIQKKYRGWKGRKDFLALRKKVVKIQAHVRGYQARKHYKIICWVVGFFDKAVLRWKRKGAGLRGFRKEGNSIDENEDEDILKVFRKQKVDEAVEQAVSRVLSMVDSPNARQQYHRMLEKFRQAKAELGSTSQGVPLSFLRDASNMEEDDLNQFP